MTEGPDRSYFRVTNLHKYQHYKDRRPPWIKWHRRCLEDEDFLALPDAHKWLRVALVLLSSSCTNVFICDPTRIKNELKMKRAPDLKELERSGFITVYASKLLAEQAEACYHRASAPIEQRSEDQRVRDQKKESLSVARAPSERNGEMTHDRVRTAWAKLFDQFYDSYPRKGHRPAAMKKWIARCPEWTVATKSDPKLAVQTRYGEIIDRVNEVSEEQGDNLGAGVTKFTPYADAFLNREF